jgi:hypothetical protein
MSTVPSFTSFDALSEAVNCTQNPGAERLACMKAVPADVIRTWENGPQGLSFGPLVDKSVFQSPEI